MFTQKISMSCTQEQYEKFLKPELLKMGYENAFIRDLGMNYIANDKDDRDGIMGFIPSDSIYNYDRTYLGTFNAPLFLARAAMTDKPEGNYGEYRVDANGNLILRKVDAMYGVRDNLRKATVSEIMEKFGEQEKCNLPKTEEELKNMMFAAYLTGQTDIINKQNGLAGRSFASWYRDNYKPISAITQPIMPEQYNVKDAIPYQFCPKCEGEGRVLKTLSTPEGYYTRYWQTCDLCNGKMMIPMHVIEK